MQSPLLAGRIIKLIGIVLFIIILSFIDLKTIWLIVNNINPFLLFLALLLNIPQLFIKSVRWNQLLRMQKIYIGLGKTFLIYLNSIYLGVITPGRIGEFTKVIFLKNVSNLDISKGFSSVLVDRIFDLYLLITIGLIGVWKFKLFGMISSGFNAVLIILIFSPLLILNKRIVEKCIKVLFTLVVTKKYKGKISEGFEKFNSSVNQLINYKLIYSLLLTLLSYTVFFLQCYLTSLSLNLSISFITITLIMSITNLISFVPITISGLGTREAMLIFLFSLIGLSSEHAVAYSLLVFSVFYFGGALLGLVAWMINPLNIKFDEN